MRNEDDLECFVEFLSLFVLEKLLVKDPKDEHYPNKKCTTNDEYNKVSPLFELKSIDQFQVMQWLVRDMKIICKRNIASTLYYIRFRPHPSFLTLLKLT